jgi:hypothetical protein
MSRRHPHRNGRPRMDNRCALRLLDRLEPNRCPVSGVSSGTRKRIPVVPGSAAKRPRSASCRDFASASSDDRAEPSALSFAECLVSGSLSRPIYGGPGRQPCRPRRSRRTSGIHPLRTVRCNSVSRGMTRVPLGWRGYVLITERDLGFCAAYRASAPQKFYPDGLSPPGHPPVSYSVAARLAIRQKQMLGLR